MTRDERIQTRIRPTALNRRMAREEVYCRLLQSAIETVENCGHLSPRRFDGKAALRLLADLARLRERSDTRYLAMIARSTATAQQGPDAAICAAVASTIRNRRATAWEKEVAGISAELRLFQARCSGA